MGQPVRDDIAEISAVFAQLFVRIGQLTQLDEFVELPDGRRRAHRPVSALTDWSGSWAGLYKDVNDNGPSVAWFKQILKGPRGRARVSGDYG